MFLRFAVALLFAFVSAVRADAVPAPALDRIHAASSLTCGVSKEEEDYSRATDHGNRAAFDLDMCKAIAVAVLGRGAHFVIKVFPDEPAAIAALTTGAIDIVPSASPTVEHMANGIVFSRPTFYDGQGFLIPNNPAVHSPLDLAGKKVCFLITSLSENGLREYAARNHIRYIWYPFSEAGEMEAAFFTGNCDALTGDVSQLANTRAIRGQRAQRYTILPQIIRTDPLAPAVMGSDLRFAAIVEWTVETLIEAEHLRVTQGNVEQMARSTDPDLEQLLGQRYGTGTTLGLDPHWGAHVIEAVGNYGEMFERDLGTGSPLRLGRGENRLWTEGGLMYGVLPAVY